MSGQGIHSVSIAEKLGKHRGMPNVYLLTKSDGSLEELSADSYQREGDDWAFTLLSGKEVARIPIEDIVSISRGPRDLDKRHACRWPEGQQPIRLREWTCPDCGEVWVAELLGTRDPAATFNFEAGEGATPARWVRKSDIKTE
jgi:hypothetical protein